MNVVREINRINERELALTGGAAASGGTTASWHDDYKDSAYIFAGGLPFDLTEGDIITVFSQFGEIVDINVPRDRETGKARGFAFIQYEDQRSTVLAVDNMNGGKVLGRTIRVDHCRDYKQKGTKNEEGEYVQPEEPSLNAMPQMVRGDADGDSDSDVSDDKDLDDEDPMAAYLRSQKREEKKKKKKQNGEGKEDSKTKEERKAEKAEKKARKLLKKMNKEAEREWKEMQGNEGPSRQSRSRSTRIESRDEREEGRRSRSTKVEGRDEDVESSHERHQDLPQPRSRSRSRSPQRHRPQLDDRHGRPVDDRPSHDYRRLSRSPPGRELPQRRRQSNNRGDRDSKDGGMYDDKIQCSHPAADSRSRPRSRSRSMSMSREKEKEKERERERERERDRARERSRSRTPPRRRRTGWDDRSEETERYRPRPEDQK